MYSIKRPQEIQISYTSLETTDELQNEGTFIFWVPHSSVASVLSVDESYAMPLEFATPQISCVSSGEHPIYFLIDACSNYAQGWNWTS